MSKKPATDSAVMKKARRLSDGGEKRRAAETVKNAKLSEKQLDEIFENLPGLREIYLTI